MSDLFNLLKTETHQLHKEVEAISGVEKIIGNSITEKELNKILEKNYKAYHLTENEINNHFSYGWDISN